MATTSTDQTLMAELIEQSKQLVAQMSNLQARLDSAPAPAPKRERLLKLSLAHYKQKGCTDEALHNHISKDHAVKASRVHAKHGVEMYGFFFTPKSTRDVLTAACAALQNEWKIEQHDLIVEFYFRDINDLVKVATDPEFLAIQEEEVPFVTKEGLVASLGWVEHFIVDKKIVGVENGQSLFGSYEEQSKLELNLGGPPPPQANGEASADKGFNLADEERLMNAPSATTTA